MIPLDVPLSGGGIWAECPDGDDVRLVGSGKPCKGKVFSLNPLTPLKFDPHVWHASESWSKGRRVLLVAYNLKGYSKARPEQAQVLSQLGFPVGAPGAAFAKQGGDPDTSQKSQKAVKSKKPLNKKEGSVAAREEQSFKASAACASDEAQGRGSTNLGQGSVVVPSVGTSQNCALAGAQGGGSVVVDEGLVGAPGSSLARELIGPASLEHVVRGNHEALGLSEAWVAGRGSGCLGARCGACDKDSVGVCSLCERDVLSLDRFSKASPASLGHPEDESFVGGVCGGESAGPLDAPDAQQTTVGGQVEGPGVCGLVGSAGGDESRIACLREAECGALDGILLSSSGLGKVVPSLIPFFPDTWQPFESSALEDCEDEGSVSLGPCPSEVDPDESLKCLKEWLSDEGSV